MNQQLSIKYITLPIYHGDINIILSSDILGTIYIHSPHTEASISYYHIDKHDLDTPSSLWK